VPRKFLEPDETAKLRSGKCPKCGGAVLGPPTARGATHQYVECQNKSCGGAWRLTLDPPRRRRAPVRHYVHFDGFVFGFGARAYKRWLRACAKYGALVHPSEHGGASLGEIHGVLDWEGDAFRDELRETLEEERRAKIRDLQEGGT
jgi:hypothetical protein